MAEDIPDIMQFIQDNSIKIVDSNENVIDTICGLIEHTTDDAPFYAVNLSKIINQLIKWKELLHNVKPYYAVKCNPNPVIIKLLSTFKDVGFDCASKHEIATVLSQGVAPENIIFANPCKSYSQIQYARSEDIDVLVFDDEIELFKIKLYHPCAKLLMRIVTDDSKSECKFSCKFGLHMDNVRTVLTKAKVLDLNVIGVSFHVGSNCHDAMTYDKSIKDVSDIFAIAKEIGYTLDTIDIGGGFPGVSSDSCDTTTTESITFEDIAIVVNKALETYFKTELKSGELKVIAEPGRYLVCSSHILVASVIGKKYKNADGKKSINYYLNEGVYGSFNCIYFDHAKPIIKPYNERDGELYQSTVFGPTCDSIDVISTECSLPDLAIGEWVYVENFGAYTIAAASTFNGFQQTRCEYYISN